MAFEWVMKLNDQVSSPASQIERSIRRVEASMRDLQSQRLMRLAADNFGLGTAAGNRKGHQQMAKIELLDLKAKLAVERQAEREQQRASKAKMAADRQVSREKQRLAREEKSQKAEAAQSRRESLKWARDWTIVLGGAYNVLRSVTSSVVDLGSALGNRVFSATGARENAFIGFKEAFGGGAARMMGMTSDLSLRTGAPVADLNEKANRWGNLGADPSMIRPMLLASLDAKAKGLDANRLEGVFSQVLSAPVLEVREIVMGLKGVVDETLIWKHLTEDIGAVMGRKILPGEAEALVKNRLAGSKFLLQALLEAGSEKHGGQIGSTAFAKADDTLGGIVDRMEARMVKLFGGIADTEGFKTLKLAMKNVLTVISGKDIQSTVNGIANSLGKMLEPLTGPEGLKNMQTFMDTMNEKLKKVAPLAATVAKSLAIIGGVVSGGMSWMVDRTDNFRKWGNQFGGVQIGPDGLSYVASDELELSDKQITAKRAREKLEKAAEEKARHDELVAALRVSMGPQMTPGTGSGSPINITINVNGDSQDPNAVKESVKSAVPSLIDALEKLNGEDGEHE